MRTDDLAQTASDHQRLERLSHDALTIADTWRLRGRWADACTLLRGLPPIVRALGDYAMAQRSLARVLTDMATFGGIDTRDEREAVLDAALRSAEASGTDALLGDV